MWKKSVALGLCLVLFAALFGCSLSSTGETGQTQAPLSEEEQLYEMLFDIRNQVVLNLDMEAEELQKMQQDYENYDWNGSKSPIYRMGELTVSITTPAGKVYHYVLEEVGVRMKGNTSRTSFYSQEEGIYNAIHLKLSFQETFDDADYYGADAKTWTEEARQARKNRTFATLEKLDLRFNRCDDSSYLKEYFAYQTYRQYGVLAPMTNLCSFNWAGEHMGVYTINEPVDKIFLAKNLPEEALGGDLYKVGWAGYANGSFTSTNSIGIENEDTGEFYAYDLKTNKKTSTHESLKNLIKTLNGTSVSQEMFAQLVDTQYLVNFAAVSYLLGNPDDMRNDYNNFYIYFRADNGQMLLIPYDYDRCLGVTAHWNPTGDGVTSDNPFSDKLAATGEQQKNPLMLYSVVAGGYYVEEYAQKLQQILAGDWFTNENFARLYAYAEANYAHLALPSKEFHNTKGMHLKFDLERTSDFASNGNISFREYLAAKTQTVNFYLADLDRYAGTAGQVSTDWYLRSDVTNWKNDDNFIMEVSNGLVSIRVQVSGQMRMKIYNNRTEKWYGAECIPEDCPVAFDTDGHTNIILEKGVYRITLDPETKTITLEKE